MSHKLAIITVVYQNYTVLDDFLKSLKEQTDKEFHIFISDLSDTKQEINTQGLPISVIPSVNLGYAHGVNIGIEKAQILGIKSFCIINSDTYFEKDFVKNVVASLKKHPNTIIGGKIYYAPGFEYHKHYTRSELGKVIWYAGGETDWKNVYSTHIGVNEVDHDLYNHETQTDFITGCFMAYEKPILHKVGKWDETYFLYYEDADFCQRATQKGIPLFYDPRIYLWHKNAQSTGGSGSLIHQKYQTKNRIKFGLKYAPLRTKVHLVINAFKDFLTKRIM